jgi:flagellar hook-associated protein 2
MTSSIDGLISGLSTTTLITQLMQVEAQPQTSLKNKVSTEQKVIAAYQSVNTRLAALQTAAGALVKDATWQSVKAISSSDAVVATATAGAPVGDTTFTVTGLAKAHTITAEATDLEAMLAVGGGLDIYIGDADPVHVDVTTNTPAGVAAAINAAALGVRASVVVTDQGTILQIAATKTGTAAVFRVDGFDPPSNVVVQGANAEITFGIPPAGYTASSQSNTFTSVVSGVTFTATRVPAGVTISVVPDSGKLADAMQSFVDAASAALAEISTQTKYDAATKTGAALTGNSTVRQLQQDLLSGISNGQTDYGSFAQLGVALDRDGKLTFDRAVFLAAYEADPATVQSVVATGMASTLQEVAAQATDPTTGRVTLAIQGRNSTVRSLTDQIGSWDIRLQARQSTLQRQYAGLEVALGKLKSQSSWLTGQIASLPSAA